MIDHDIDDQCEIEAQEWAYECALLESLVLTDTERAEMEADMMAEALEAEAANELPVVTLPPKPSPWRVWSPAERGQLAAALREIGTTITEVNTRAVFKAFTLIGERLGDRVLLMLAYMDGVPIAGALNLVGADTLYGRYWGCVGDCSPGNSWDYPNTWINISKQTVIVTP